MYIHKFKHIPVDFLKKKRKEKNMNACDFIRNFSFRTGMDHL